METDNTNGQGLYITDPETGRIYAIPAGGSDAGGSVGDGGTVEGSDTTTTEVQSESSNEVTESTPPSNEGGSGQGFLEPYLKDVPEEQRPIVEPILERYRQEQDRNFNQRFEQLQEEARIPMAVHEALIQDPIQTLDWIADRMLEERGLDLRSELRNRWYQGGGESQQGQDSSGQSEQDPNRPMTQAELDEYLEQREQERQQEYQRQQFEEQQARQQAQTVNNWVSEAAKSFSLELDDSQGEDPLRSVIIMQANAIHEQGIAKGKAAVEMATEAVAKRFGRSTSNSGADNSRQPSPNLANGGVPPPSPDFDVGDAKQRKARMAELLAPPPNH